MASVITFSAPKVDTGEIKRYMRAAGEADGLIADCLTEAEKVLRYSVAFDVFPVFFSNKSADNGLIDLCFAKTESKDLCKNLVGCDRIVLFAATVGIGIDRLIARYGAISPAKALCFEAIGNERVESLCDAFNGDIIKKYGACAPRFSPGYGDLDLSLQKSIFSVLPCSAMGLNLNASLLMSPSKSVTAIIGIKK